MNVKLLLLTLITIIITVTTEECMDSGRFEGSFNLSQGYFSGLVKSFVDYQNMPISRKFINNTFNFKITLKNKIFVQIGNNDDENPFNRKINDHGKPLIELLDEKVYKDCQLCMDIPNFINCFLYDDELICHDLLIYQITFTPEKEGIGRIGLSVVTHRRFLNKYPPDFPHNYYSENNEHSDYQTIRAFYPDVKNDDLNTFQIEDPEKLSGFWIKWTSRSNYNKIGPIISIGVENQEFPLVEYDLSIIQFDPDRPDNLGWINTELKGTTKTRYIFTLALLN